MNSIITDKSDAEHIISSRIDIFLALLQSQIS
jgi:hypothetical protein